MTTHLPVGVERPHLSTADIGKGAAVAAGAAGLGIAVTAQPAMAVAGALAVAAIVLVAARPALGVYAIVVLTPLTAGIDRGTVLPLVRPSEAVTAIVAAGAFARWLVLLRTTRDIRLRIDPLLASVVALAVASSVFPLLWMRVQGESVDSDDLLYALLMWKFLTVFVVVRVARLDDRQTWRALSLSVATAVLVGLVSLLQTAGWGPVVSVLQKYFTTNDNVDAITASRGSSTLGLPIAVADLLTFNLAIVMGMMWLRRRITPVLLGAALMLTLGVVGAGEFSGIIGLLVGVITLCIVMRTTWPARFLFGGAIVAIPVVWPVIEKRLSGFQSVSGLPISWTGRLDNLRSYFWPVLFEHHRYLLGVRPAARVPAPHRANGFIWIESGYTWLLWAGGIPLFVAFLWFVVLAGRTALRAVRFGTEPRRIAGLATFVAVTVISVLMVFDPHLTYRGVADELFTLLALCAGAAAITIPGRTKRDA